MIATAPISYIGVERHQRICKMCKQNRVSISYIGMEQNIEEDSEYCKDICINLLYRYGTGKSENFRTWYNRWVSISYIGMEQAKK